MNMYCDNYSDCQSYVLDQGSESLTEQKARAKGWHTYHGQDMGGRPHHARLCGRCVDDRRRALKPPPPPQAGQRELFEIMVYTAPGS